MLVSCLPVEIVYMVSSLGFISSERLVERQREVLRRLRQYRKQVKWTAPPPKGEYRAERPSPYGVVPCHAGDPEPIVDVADLYDLDLYSALVTVNSYDALVLNSKNLLIADIDFGDPRLAEHGGASDVREVCNWLKRLKILDQHLSHRYGSPYFPFEHPRFSEKSYAVYRTAAGCRVICVSEPIPWETDGWFALHFMRFVPTDPQYMQLCRKQKCYRAHSTPKPWRDRGGYGRTCRLVKFVNPGVPVDPSLLNQLRLHAEITGVIEYPDGIDERYLA
jgi:hypothetical protein